MGLRSNRKVFEIRIYCRHPMRHKDKQSKAAYCNRKNIYMLHKHALLHPRTHSSAFWAFASLSTASATNRPMYIWRHRSHPCLSRLSARRRICISNKDAVVTSIHSHFYSCVLSQLAIDMVQVRRHMPWRLHGIAAQCTGISLAL